MCVRNPTTSYNAARYCDTVAFDTPREGGIASLGQVVARIRAVLVDLRGTATAVTAARETIAVAADRLAAVVEGTSRSEPAEVRSLLQSSVEALDDTEGHLAAALDASERYLREIGASPRPVTVLGPPQPPPVGVTEPVPDYVRHVGREFRHVQPPSRQVVGYLVDRFGHPLHGDRLLSGSDGPARGAPGLNHDYPVAGWEAALTHVEGHAAALLRRPGAPTEAVLVLSKVPCPAPRGCQVALPKILPVGTTLHVYVLGSAGPPTWHGSYTGDGRGVAR